MTDQRDLAAELQQIISADAQFSDTEIEAAITSRLLRQRRTLLLHIAALSRELEELRRPMEQSEELAEICSRIDAGNGLWSDVPKLRAAIDSAQREIARLSSPPEERAEIRDRNEARKEDPDGWDLVNRGRFAAVSDIDTLLQDLARARNALDDRVRMLGIVQDSLSERNRDNVELQAKCERLEKAAAVDDDHRNIGAALMETLAGSCPTYSWLQCPTEIVCDLLNDKHDMEREFRGHIERLQGALKMVLSLLTISDTGLSKDQQADVDAALATSQHTAGSGDGVAGD